MSLHPMLTKEFYRGRTDPKLHTKSAAYVDHWKEEVHRCLHGFEHRGTRLNKWHYFLLNFVHMELVDPKTFEAHFALPYFSQEDDRFFKMVEEAEQSQLGVMLLTGRGWGKSYDMAAIMAHTYTFFPQSHNIISSSYEKPSKDLFKKTDIALQYMPRPLRHNRLTDLADERIESGMRYFEDGTEKKKGFRSILERLTYGDNPGKTRGTRPRKQVFEEIGAWNPSESASLIRCYDESRGSFFRGSIMTGQPFLIGTGGQMKSGATKDAKEMFNNPEAFNLYAIDIDGKKKCIFMPACKKFTGFYEKKGPVLDKITGEQVGFVVADGVSDEEGATANLLARRKKLETSPASYAQELQEYPLTIDEMFTVTGVNKFNQHNIALHRQALEKHKERTGEDLYENGFLHWKKNNHKITGVEWETHPDGPFQRRRGEEPRTDGDGNPYRNLYCAGLDSIDQARDDSMTDNGSKLALFIKKRYLHAEDTYDVYVLRYVDRPNRVETAFDNVLKALWYYNARVNVEYSKISIVPYFRIRKQYWRFTKRPTIALADMNSDKYTSLIGTQMVTKIIQHMNVLLQMLFENNVEAICWDTTLEQARDYDPDNQTEFDEIVAIGLCEMMDEDMVELTASADPPRDTFMQHGFGYYTDADGFKRYGVLPATNSNRLELTAPAPHVRWTDAESLAAEYYHQ
jgi:hypothetical protein